MGRLSYPFGVQPGFDSSHVAAKNCALSSIASGANHVNLLQGFPGTIVNAPTARMLSSIGPATRFSSASDKTSWSGVTPAAASDFTAAAILVPVGNVGTVQTVIGNGDAFCNWLHYNTGGTMAVGIRVGSTDGASTVVLTTGVPYFIVESWSGSLQKWNLGVVNLSTGQIVAQTNSLAATSAAGDGNIYVGGWTTNNRPANADIAAASYSKVYLSVPQIFAWARDPWAFWYPASAS